MEGLPSPVAARGTSKNGELAFGQTRESFRAASRDLQALESASRDAINGQALVIDRRSGIAQRLLEILGFEKGILGYQGRSVRISRKKLEDAANGNSHPADARLAAALRGLNRNSVKLIDRCHMLSLDYRHLEFFSKRGLDCHNWDEKHQGAGLHCGSSQR